MARFPRFKEGDLVRFREGRVDWEVADVRPHPSFSDIQRIKLRSGMTDRIMHTTNEHILPRDLVIGGLEAKERK